MDLRDPEFKEGLENFMATSTLDDSRKLPKPQVLYISCHVRSHTNYSSENACSNYPVSIRSSFPFVRSDFTLVWAPLQEV